MKERENDYLAMQTQNFELKNNSNEMSIVTDAQVNADTITIKQSSDKRDKIGKYMLASITPGSIESKDLKGFSKQEKLLI